MVKDNISRQEAVLLAALALARAREKAAELYEQVVSGGDEDGWHVARWNAQDIMNAITEALGLAWAFSGSQQEAAAFMQEASMRASRMLAYKASYRERLEEPAKEPAEDGGEVPF